MADDLELPAGSYELKQGLLGVKQLQAGTR